MKDVEFKIVAKPFDWKDNLSEVAQEDFLMYQRDMSYGASQTIGMALAKLQLMEEQGLYPDVLQEIIEKLEEREKAHLRVSYMCVTPKYEMQEIRIAKTYRNAIEICKEVGGMND